MISVLSCNLTPPLSTCRPGPPGNTGPRGSSELNRTPRTTSTSTGTSGPHTRSLQGRKRRPTGLTMWWTILRRPSTAISRPGSTVRTKTEIRRFTATAVRPSTSASSHFPASTVWRARVTVLNIWISRMTSLYTAQY